jgi:hypothetical protein
LGGPGLINARSLDISFEGESLGIGVALYSVILSAESVASSVGCEIALLVTVLPVRELVPVRFFVSLLEVDINSARSQIANATEIFAVGLYYQALMS